MSGNSSHEVVSVMMNIVNTVCEHESDLTLTSLMNYMDLFRIYLTYDSAPDLGKDVLAANCSPITIRREKQAAPARGSARAEGRTDSRPSSA